MSELAGNSIKSRVEKSPSLRRLYNNIMKDLEEVELELRLFSRSPNKLISDISTYLFQTNGKRIRPALLLLCSKLLGYKGKEHILMSTLVEAIHTASLIHDDIIDNSKIRRGRESIHARWGPNITVLLGDYLYIKALGLSLQSKHRQIIQILTSISARMVEGELTEYYLSGNLGLAEKDYLDIINKKTASLFSASCRIGGILGKASKKEENYLAEYGANLGMSFQIIDDLLDFTGDEKTLGKPILCDLSEGRITLPLIYTLNNDGRENKKRVIELLKQKNQDKESLEEILKIVKSNGALDYTHKKAEEFSHKSREIISQFPKSTHREALSLLSEFILKRRN
ncbi:MAG: polyprenyl synthetase family protein [Candidatus Aminicenantes bacterium]|nr:MAG: polyprenyl synthetase family protein [Candidatus Aminicenantes bacterium]